MSIRLPKDPPLVEVPITQVLWRVHSTAYGPVWFGPGKGTLPCGRFDAPAGEFGICYFGATLGVSILEVLVRSLKLQFIPHDELRQRAASTLSLAAPLQMLQLEGKGLTSFAISADVVSGDRYHACQDMALRVHEELSHVDGIQYRSRWDNSELCWAVFDRAAGKMGDILGTQPLDDLAVVRPALRPYPRILIG